MKLMWRLFTKISILYMCSQLIGCTASLSKDLINDSKMYDPPIIKYNNAYLIENRIILDYTTGIGQMTDRRYSPPGDNWSELSIEKSHFENSLNLDIKIHREKFVPKTTNLTKLQIVDLNKELGSSYYSPIIDYLKNKYNGQPIVGIYDDGNHIFDHVYNIYIAYIAKNTSEMQFVTDSDFTHARNYYIPTDNYPKIALLYPFAKLLDVATYIALFPVTLVFHGVDDR